MDEMWTGADVGAGGERQAFSRPDWRLALEFALWGFGCLVVMTVVVGVAPSREEFQFLFGGTVFFIAVALFLSIQHVIVEGTTVRVMSVPTGLRWRVFEAHEVAEARFSVAGQGQLAHSLALTLVPAPHRSWKSVVLSVSCAGIDVPVLVAVMRAVSRAQPDLLVKGLPEDYVGALPAPAPRLWSGDDRRGSVSLGEQARQLQQTQASGAPAAKRRKKRGKGKR